MYLPLHMGFVLRQKKPEILPLRHFFQIVTPFGDSVSTPIVGRSLYGANEPFTFEVSLNVPRPTTEVVDTLTNGNILVRMWHMRPLKSEVISLAVAPLSGLRHFSELILPLRFMTPQGICTEFCFELEIVCGSSLSSKSRLVVSEELHVLLDD
jgi:hypothetical protein